MTMRCSIVLLFGTLGVWCAGVATAVPLGTGFTYQGQLRQAGVPVEGAVTLRFSLWQAPGSGDPPVGGVRVGSVQTLTNVPVSGGVFSVALNEGGQFGPQAFNGDGRWLQVEVCGDSACSSATVLGPRQALTGVPYALGPWQLSGSNLSYTGGNVGIGTTTPGHALHVKATEPALVLEDAAAASLQSGYISFQNGTSETGWMGYGTAGSPDMTFANARASGDIVLWATGERMRVDSGGNVGVGTSTPASKLEVRGDIRLGSAGELFAVGGPENLRIVRGEVLAAGTVNSGSGFTVTHPSTGIYNIVFTTPFQAATHTSFTATPVANSGTLSLMLSSLPGPTVVALRIVNGSGAPADGAFSFIVVGDR